MGEDDGVDPDGLPLPQPTLPGALLTDQAWLFARVLQLGGRSGCSERRTNATLWWYSASAVLLAPAIRELITGGGQIDLTPASLRFTLRSNGYLERVIPGPSSPRSVDAALDVLPQSALGGHLDDALGQVIVPLARIGRASERSLWAIAADSLASVVLGAANLLLGGSAEVPAMAQAIARASTRIRPLPRFVDVDPGTGRTCRYVRRGSCCLLLRVPDGKCLACPNQTPAVRLERLVRHARSVAPSQSQSQRSN